jgi:hypothetical protein
MDGTSDRAALFSAPCALENRGDDVLATERYLLPDRAGRGANTELLASLILLGHQHLVP